MSNNEKRSVMKMHESETRPWGEYEVVLDAPDVKIKLIEVLPKQRMSYQYHEHRGEVWTIIHGTLTIILNDEKLHRGPGQSIKIPKGAKHRAWNETDLPVHFVEVQTGTYFGEDDIIRIEDDYNRE
ncbi:phosphomannose isomerase type II C-terminal cupin domain [bacterium]|nr:phosphomannose isomerase type II C-terminal cupin domain [bacterium]